MKAYKSIFRLAVALVAAIVAADGFAQGIARPNNLLNRNRNMGANRSVVPPAGQPAAKAAVPPATNAAGEHALNFEQTPVDIVLQAYANELDKTYLKDPAVPNAQITLKTREGQKMTKEEYLEAIEVVLEMNGIHIEEYGEKFIRVLPRKDVRKEGIPLIMNAPEKLKESGRVVSMMIPFRNIGTEEAQKALEGFKSNNGILLVFERTNSILVTDTEQNINRMLEIARAIDVATPVLENVFVRQIKNASAADIKTALEAIVQDSQKELEKNGNNKRNSNVAQPAPNFGGGLLRRPGQNNQPQQPVNQPSLVLNVSDADRGMIRGKVLILSDDRSNKLVIITQKANMDFFDKVIEQLDIETTPDTVVKVYRLKYAEAEEVSDMINDLIGNSSGSKSSGKENQNRNSKTGGGSNLTGNRSSGRGNAGANKRTGDAKAGELTKDNTTVLADKRINGIVVMTEKELVPTIEQIIESMDIRLSQVLIETVIIEVTLGDGIQAGVDWVQKGRQANNKNVTTATGQPLYYKQRTITTTDAAGNTRTSTTITPDLVDSNYKYESADGSVIEEASSLVGKTTGMGADGAANYFTAGSYSQIGGGAGSGDSKGGSLAANIASGVSSNLFSKALNLVFSSDELGISAVLQATKTDSRTKYIASPVIMTLDNKEATIEATDMVYLFKGYQYSGSTYNGSAVPDYEQKDIGIKLKVTPKINPNGTVMLTLDEAEYSQMGTPQVVDGVQQETTTTRKMSADALLENNQTVVFAGLTSTFTSEAESGIPYLKDIPWIGKWLFGYMEQDETRKELLIFMTPYVLTDADAAEAEAIRRKKSLSDQHAWDDHGWSASKLADPVSKKEQMRRLKEAWKLQDEARQTKIEIEKAKIARAKELEKMNATERKLWLEMHKKELDEEQQESLEKKMLDKDSQEELKKLAEKIRKEKLAEADKADKANAAEYEEKNERARLDAEKAEAAKKAAEKK